MQVDSKGLSLENKNLLTESFPDYEFDLFNDLNTNGLNEEEMRLFPLKKAEDWMWKEESSSDSGVDSGGAQGKEELCWEGLESCDQIFDDVSLDSFSDWLSKSSPFSSPKHNASGTLIPNQHSSVEFSTNQISSTTFVSTSTNPSQPTSFFTTIQTPTPLFTQPYIHSSTTQSVLSEQHLTPPPSKKLLLDSQSTAKSVSNLIQPIKCQITSPTIILIQPTSQLKGSQSTSPSLKQKPRLLIRPKNSGQSNSIISPEMKKCQMIKSGERNHLKTSINKNNDADNNKTNVNNKNKINSENDKKDGKNNYKINFNNINNSYKNNNNNNNNTNNNNNSNNNGYSVSEYAHQSLISLNADLEFKAVKRQQRMIKNRESASLSRKRKKEYVQGLEERLKKWQEEAQQLKIDNHALKLRIQALEAENSQLKSSKGKHSNKRVLLLSFILFFTFTPSLLFPSLQPRQSPSSSLMTSFSSSSRLSRHLMSLDDNPSNRSLSAQEVKCKGQHINSTEAMRLTAELRGWASKQKHQVMRLRHNFFNSSLATDARDVLNDAMQKKKNKTNNKNDKKNNNEEKIRRMGKKVLGESRDIGAYALNLFHQHHPSSLELLLSSLPADNHTFYIVSFHNDHLLLPPLHHNKSHPPRISIIVPANHNDSSSTSMMNIQCQVVATNLISLNAPYHQQAFNDLYYSNDKKEKARPTNNDDDEGGNRDKSDDDDGGDRDDGSTDVDNDDGGRDKNYDGGGGKDDDGGFLLNVITSNGKRSRVGNDSKISGNSSSTCCTNTSFVGNNSVLVDKKIRDNNSNYNNISKNKNIISNKNNNNNISYNKNNNISYNNNNNNISYNNNNSNDSNDEYTIGGFEHVTNHPHNTTLQYSGDALNNNNSYNNATNKKKENFFDKNNSTFKRIESIGGINKLKHKVNNMNINVTNIRNNFNNNESHDISAKNGTINSN